MKKAISLALTIALVFSLCAVSVPVSAAATVTPPADMTVKCDFEHFPTDGNFMSADDAANVVLTGAAYDDGKALKWKVTDQGFKWCVQPSVPVDDGDWTGATELWVWVDATGWDGQLNLGLGVTDKNGNGLIPGRQNPSTSQPYAYQNVSYFYFDGSGTKQNKKLNSWGWIIDLPNQYKGWVGLNLTEYATAMAGMTVDMAHITSFLVKAEYTDDMVNGYADKYFYVDKVMANGTPATPTDQDVLNGLLAYPGGKKWALTFSFDDGAPYDYDLVAIFNKYGVKGTFNLIGKNIQDNNWAVAAGDVATLYAGHEVANHTWTHQYMTQLTKEQQLSEFSTSKTYLESLVGYTVRGVAYPYGTGWYDDNVIASAVSSGAVYARTTTNTHSFDVPANFMTWDATVYNNESTTLINTLFDTFVAVDRGIYSNLYYYWGHSFEFDQQYGGYDRFDAFCQKVSAYQDRVWFATNIEIYDYIQATRQVTLSDDRTTVTNGSTATVWISDDGDPVAIAAGQSYVLGSQADQLKGDANNDGKVSIVDARMILRSVVGKTTLSEAAKKRADVNDDGKVTVMDVRQVLRMTLQAAPALDPTKLTYTNGQDLNLYRTTNEIPFYEATDVDKRLAPTVTPYVVTGAQKKSDMCVIICPGGSYWDLWLPTEGPDIAAGLNAQGVSAFVLHYRPAVKGYHYEAMLTDVFRAVRFVRYYAPALGIDPDKVVVMGFSAGGHLATMSLEHWDDALVTDHKVDAIDNVSSRPDAGVVCYGVQSFVDADLCHADSRRNFLGSDAAPQALKEKFSGELGVRADMPPTFIWHNKGDTAVPVGNAQALDAAMTKVDVPHELLLFEGGYHGGGLWTGQPQGVWLSQCLTFLQNTFNS